MAPNQPRKCSTIRTALPPPDRTQESTFCIYCRRVATRASATPARTPAVRMSAEIGGRHILLLLPAAEVKHLNGPEQSGSPNPVCSGIVFSSLVQNSDCYPIAVYNTLGQVVTHIPEPHEVLDLSCGIYFLEMNNARRCCVKIVVVK